MRRAEMRAISPVIATIIIIAVTIAIAVAVAGWMMGLWTGFTSKPALEVVDATLYTNGTLDIIIRNVGQGDAQIDRIEVGGELCELANADVKKAEGQVLTDAWDKEKHYIIVKAGDVVRVQMTCNAWKDKFPAGSSQQVVVKAVDGTTTTGIAKVRAS